MTKQRQSRIALLAVAMLLSGALFGLVTSDNASAGNHDIDGFVQPNLTGVTVTFLNSETGTSNNATTAADGYYYFDGLASGNYVVRFTKPGYLSQLEMWEVNSPGSMDDVQMTAVTSGTTEISGRVIDADGNVTGANISFRSEIQWEASWWNGTDVGYTWTTTTDSDGNYTFLDLPDETSFDVRIESTNHYTYISNTAVSSDFTILKITSSNNQNVRVKDVLGNTINDATVFMYDTETSTWTSSSKLGGATYVLSPKSGSEIYVYAYHEDHNPSVKRIESVVGTDTFDMIVGENDAAERNVVYISESPSDGAQSAIPKIGDRIVKENPDPSASITITSTYTDMDGVYVIANGEQVNFSGLSSSSPVGISQYSWSFGTSGAESSEIFTSGSTVVNLTVFDTFGDVSTSNVTIMADGSNPSPVVNVVVKEGTEDPGEAYNGSNVDENINIVVFNANQSTDTDSKIVSYDWDFGYSESLPDTGDIVSHSFQDPGNFDVELTVTDAAGNTGSIITTITVNDIEAPVADFTWSYTNDSGSQVNRSAIEGVPIHFDAGETKDNSEGPLTYIWDFGDGTNGTGVMTNHIFNETQDGGFNVVLDVTDSSGNKDQIFFIVEPAKKDRPDIYVSSLNFSNDNPSEGDVVVINATIRLLGMNLTEPFAVTFYLDGCLCLSGDGAPNGTVIGTVEVNESSLIITDDNMNPSYNVQVPWTATAGTHTIYVWVDANEAIDEGAIDSNEEKNYLFSPITVKPASDSRDWTSIALIVLVVILAFGAVGYIYRDTLFK